MIFHKNDDQYQPENCGGITVLSIRKASSKLQFATESSSVENLTMRWGSAA